jgi:hypothetical protein
MKSTLKNSIEYSRHHVDSSKSQLASRARRVIEPELSTIKFVGLWCAVGLQNICIGASYSRLWRQKGANYNISICRNIHCPRATLNLSEKEQYAPMYKFNVTYRIWIGSKNVNLCVHCHVCCTL